MQGFDGAAFDRWLTTDPRDRASDDACVICGEEPEYDYDGGGTWGTVEYARTTLPVCSLQCACVVAASADDAQDRAAATRCVVDTLRRSDDYLACTLRLQGGRTLVGTIIASSGGCVTVEDDDTAGLSIVPWDRVADVQQLEG